MLKLGRGGHLSVGGPVQGAMSIPVANPNPERNGGVQAASDRTRAVERDLNVACGQVGPLAVGEELHVVRVRARDIIPLEVNAADEDGGCRWFVRRVPSAALADEVKPAAINAATTPSKAIRSVSS